MIAQLKCSDVCCESGIHQFCEIAPYQGFWQNAVICGNISHDGYYQARLLLSCYRRPHKLVSASCYIKLGVSFITLQEVGPILVLVPNKCVMIDVSVECIDLFFLYFVLSRICAVKSTAFCQVHSQRPSTHKVRRLTIVHSRDTEITGRATHTSGLQQVSTVNTQKLCVRYYRSSLSWMPL